MLGCPGHCGHIELPVPVYHLTFIDQLLRLLRGKCGYCHHFRLARVQINEYVSRLRLIRCGLVQEANEMHEHIDINKGKTGKDNAEDSESDDDNEDIVGQRNNYVKRCMKRAGISKHDVRSIKEKNATISDARRQVLKDSMPR
jgi:DNA-directed RNA polymerase beta' subunit